MRTGFNKTLLALVLLFSSAAVYAMPGTIIVSYVTGIAIGSAAWTIGMTVAAFAINIVASTIIAKAMAPSMAGSGAFGTGGLDGSASSAAPNPGNRQQLPPVTDNKLPVVYGRAFVGGIVTDLSITGDNQNLYYVLALCEVTNNGTDSITFGDVYYGGKKVVFGANGAVNALLDESTGIADGAIAGKMSIFLYSNGSNAPANTSQTAIAVMQSAGLTYTWDSSKAMTNTAFAIVKLTYSNTAGVRGLEPTKFEVINNRTAPGDCFSDYLQNTVYGAAIDDEQIDFASLTALNTYSNEMVSFNTYDNFLTTQKRFQFDGVLDTRRTVMQNLQDMATSCDCLLKYNEITGKWGVIVQQPTYTVAMALDDSNMVSALQVTPLDLSSSFNVLEAKFPNKDDQDAFDTSTMDLAEIAPTLLYPNEPVNKQSVSLPLVNNSVRAQLIANRLLKSGREDLQVQVSVNFVGIQLEAGDIVTVTNANYGWAAKLFRINKVVEEFNDAGEILAKLTLAEFNPAVFNDVLITQFTPSPNSGIGDPLVFGSIPAPQISTQYPTDVNPYFLVNVTASQSGVIQYAEVWYSAFQNPTTAQLIFAATSEVQSNGNPYTPGQVLPAIPLLNIPSGNWYFFSRMVNSLGQSAFSTASQLFFWRPQTLQFTDQYLNVAYANNATGTSGFSFNPRNKLYFGLQNSASPTPSNTASDYRWFLAEPTFASTVYLCYSNRSGRKFSFDTGFAGYAGGSGRFVPTQTNLFDPRLWSALPDGTNTIDLDQSTGQVLTTGTSSSGNASGEIDVINNPDGKVVASLKQFLDFGPGVYQLNSPVATLTVDIYGRVVGFQPPDSFFYTSQQFVATSNQTVFTVTRTAGYISGQCFVFRNGILLDTSEYTDTGGTTGTVTLANPCATGDAVTIISMKASNSATGVYTAFNRYTATLTNASSYTASGFTLQSGFEMLFLNGTIVNEQDYNITGQVIGDFPDIVNGLLTIIQFVPNNLGTPAGDPTAVVTNTVVGQTQYFFSYQAASFNLYSNGALQVQGTDYTTQTGAYTLSNTPDTITTVMVNQTFARTGAV